MIMTIPPTTVVEVAVGSRGSGLQLGTLGEWFAGLVTLGALGFAWVQIRHERAATAEALAIAREQLTLELDRRQAEQRAERERLARLTELHVHTNEGFGDRVMVTMDNRSEYSISLVWFYVTQNGGPTTPQSRPMDVPPGGTVTRVVELNEPLERLSDLTVEATFCDALGNFWRRDAFRNGFLAEHDPESATGPEGDWYRRTAR